MEHGLQAGRSSGRKDPGPSYRTEWYHDNGDDDDDGDDEYDDGDDKIKMI